MNKKNERMNFDFFGRTFSRKEIKSSIRHTRRRQLLLDISADKEKTNKKAKEESKARAGN